MVTIDREALLQRFLRYVQVDTQANPDTDQYPSSEGQWTLGKILVGELRELGLADAAQDDHALVTATVLANIEAPTIVFNSHLDTSPEAPGANVRPQVIRDYAGGDIDLPGNPELKITLEESPELKDLIGCTLVTTDGTTLLGADDKAGVAIIMQLVATLMEQSDLPHGEIRILFTCDEEIGRGVNHVDVPGLNAVAGYTLDGPAANEVDVETFSADGAKVTVRGVNIHPAIAKDRMVNSMRATAHFLSQLPADFSPERTEGRDGFLHPYHLQGQVDLTVIKILLRDFEDQNLVRQAKLLHQAAAATEAAIPGCQVEVEISEQYRNMREGLAKEPRAVAFALAAHERLGRVPKQEIIRGGTDGSRLTALGLPTPNLSSGQHNLHSRLEWACLDEMEQAVQVLVELAAAWTGA
ncbi:MAG: peptidase T [Planctomycetota bacterium]